jgi:chloramphenicol O-acetyltransferase type A
MDYPWLDISTAVDATVPWTVCQPADGPSFFAASVFLALRAVNAVLEFRQRIQGDEVVVYDVVNAGITVLRDDGTFGFGFVDSSDDFSSFASAAAAEVERVRSESQRLVDRPVDDLIHFSILPWFSFTAIGHPRQRGRADSIPKIVLGRCTRQGSTWQLPVAVSLHHGLVDALHVARFLDDFQGFCDDAERLLETSPSQPTKGS